MNDLMGGDVCTMIGFMVSKAHVLLSKEMSVLCFYVFLVFHRLV